ncbi:lysophospholipid acyltransferase family protein [Nocardioides sp. InS609-2]|uniref:lysophospholipid acyltransferase family protein n=1 Tax=Nocardioides sp. InS609-2 TaxID=2760705 RepID=UPI0020BF4032|nr:lysophospholipid acyltransferase family protein [Nocardioides sp. InS609-2]
MPESDAQIIPIGTSGRPGRGTGRSKPSSAARSLAPTKKKAPAKPAPEPAAVKSAPAPKSAPPAAAAPVTSATTATDRHPMAGIPVTDWLSAFQQAAVELFDDQWERRLAEFMAFLRRRLEGGYAVDEYGFDQEVTERFFLAALRPIAEKWFRIEVRGIENIPTEGGALVVSNHSGTVPVDGLMTMSTIHDRTGRFLRPLGADLVFKMPLVSSLARKAGATLACNEDAERMLTNGELVGVWPEGFKGIGKPWSDRYKLQRFGRGGFVSAALRTGVPIVPLSVVGAEEIYPLVGNIPSLARLLGVPYLPITPLFPWLGPIGMVPLPSKWLMEFGEPIRTDSYAATEAEDPMLVFNVTDQVRETIQQTLYTLLLDRQSVFR